MSVVRVTPLDPRLEESAGGYRCPGEDVPIDRATHWQRLAAGYTACGRCAHRHDDGPLTARQRQRIAALARRGPSAPLVRGEGLTGTLLNDVTPPLVEQFAAALGLECHTLHDAAVAAMAVPAAHRPAHTCPTVLVARDARPQTAELLAAAARGLRWAYCDVVDMGTATCSELAHAIAAIDAAGGLVIGNSSAAPSEVTLRLFGRRAVPYSSPGRLDAIAGRQRCGLDRPSRRAGRQLLRTDNDAYLGSLRECYHALRPLRLVLETSCRPLIDAFEQLSAQAALVPLALAAHAPRGAASTMRATETAPATSAARATTSARATSAARHAPHAATSDGGLSPRLAASLGAAVRQQAAHCGVWIDAEGERLVLFDERGRRVASQHVLCFLARAAIAPGQRAKVVVEPATGAAARAALEQMGAEVVEGPATREGLHATIERQAAIIGGGPSGRIWHQAGVVVADALRTLSLLLVEFSRSDRPVSAWFGEELGAAAERLR